MRTTARVMRGLAAVLLGSALLAGASGTPATAATETSPQAEAVNALPAPTLEKATIKGDNVVLIWNRVEDESVTGYLIYANGKLLPYGWRTSASADHIVLYLASLGLTGREVFTVAAGSDFGPDGIPANTSPQSNGLVPVAPATLPAPVLTSATDEGDFFGTTVTLTWTASQSEEEVISYWIFAPNYTGQPFLLAVDNVTTVTFNPDACGGACPLTGAEEYSVEAHDRTMAQSPRSNSLVPTEG